MNKPTEDIVLYKQIEKVALISLNRPEAYNALSKAVVDKLIEYFVKAEKDESIKVIILTGVGKAFSAGVDLKELTTNPSVLNDDLPLIEIFKTRKKPLLGAINGFCITGALELALSCDILYASTNAVFADTHTKVGIMPTWGISQRLSRLIGESRAKEMSFSGRKIDAQLALSWGIVNRVFEAEHLMEQTLSLAHEISNNITTAVQGMKMLIDNGANMGLEDALDYEYKTSHAHNDQVDFAGMMDKLNQMKKNK